MYNVTYLTNIASAFVKDATYFKIEQLNKGFINKTFIVRPSKIQDLNPFILQRINPVIFAKPIALFNNYQLIHESINNKVISSSLDTYRDFFLPSLLPNIYTKKPFIVIEDYYWRALQYVPSSINYDIIKEPDQVNKLLKHLATFHLLTSQVDLDKFSVPINNFHNTPFYLKEYYSFINCNLLENIDFSDYQSNLNYIFNYIDNNKSEAHLLDDPIRKNSLLLGVIHGDPKASNFLFDSTGNNVLSLIDFDTCSSGIILYDIADCIRSTCNPLGEEPDEINDVYFSLEFYEEALKGYFSVSNCILSEIDVTYLPLCLRSVTFELAIRFFTDFLKGNLYFSVNHDLQNLYRARVQLRLLESIKSQWNDIISLTNKIM